MWTTARQDVRSLPDAAGRPEFPGLADGQGPAACQPEALDCADPEASIADEAPALAGSGRTPARPMHASATTPAALPSAARSARDGRCWEARSRFQSRPSAPWRTGSSMYFQDSEASRILAAICTAARTGSSVEFAGVVSTITG